MAKKWIQTLPYDADLEARVLCMSILDPSLLDSVSISDKDFYVWQYGDVFRVIQSMYDDRKVINAQTIWAQIKLLDMDIEEDALIDITCLCFTTTSFVDDVERLQKYARMRSVIGLAHRLWTKAQDMGEDEDIESLIEQLHHVMSSGASAVSSMGDQLLNAYNNMLVDMDFVSTWYEDLDTTLVGFQPGQLIIVAGRPWAGKTAFMMNMMAEQAKKGIKVGMISLEMESKELIWRMFSSETAIPYHRIKKNDLTEEERLMIKEQCSKLEKNMHIIDDAYSLTQIKAKCKALAKQWCKAIYIDYLQLISMWQKSWDGNRNNEVSFLSRELKLLSKTIKCPLVVWSQLSRAVESRANKRPILSDLRDSWSIEQDADTVIMLYRWDYYNTDEVPDGILDVLIRKHRSGDTKEIPMKFDWPTVKIRNQSDKSDNPF